MDVRTFIPNGLMPTARFLNQTWRAYARDAQFAAARIGRSPVTSHRAVAQGSHANTIRRLKQDGYAVLPNAFPAGELRALRDDVQSALDSGRIYPVMRNPRSDGEPMHLSDAEIKLGEDRIAQRANIAYVRDPLVACAAAFPFVFSDLVLDIAEAFYGCRPSITGCYLMKSFVNDAPDAGFNHFHCDTQSAKFIKFFLYLNDVTEGGGPFCYIGGSHRSKPLGWRANNNRSPEQIEEMYGAGAFRPIHADVGDLVIANTTGFHRAEKPKNAPRYAFMINTGLHPINHSIGTEPIMSDSQHKSLQPKQRRAANYFKIGA